MNAQTQASKNALHKSLERRHNASTSLAALWRPALLQAFVKLDPRQLLRSPVMLVVELTAVLTTLLCFVPDQAVPTSVALQIALWLWFTPRWCPTGCWYGSAPTRASRPWTG